MNFADKDGLIWLDGEFVEWRDAKIHVLTHTLHYGMGVFEGVRAYETAEGPAIFRLDCHTKRLFQSMKILNMDPQFDYDTMITAQLEAIRRNNLNSCYIRPMCFYGSEGMGLHAGNLKVHTIVAVWPWGVYLGADALEQGIRVQTSSFTRHHVNATMCKAKANGNYINSMLALQEAERCGYNEALLLDAQGYVAEGSGENVFMVKNGELHTPTLTSCLDGITRRTIMQFAKDLNIKVTERQITRDELYIADEIFFTGTAAEVTPIRELDGRSIGSGKRGPITEQLQTLYFDTVTGKADQYKEFLTVV